MRRFLLSLTFCSFLLITGVFIFSTASSAKEDLVSHLLRVPAPPPPNPLMPPRKKRDELFYSKRKVPGDDAPIRELMDYWRHQSNGFQDLRYMPKPSDRVMQRLQAEISKKPKSVADFLNIFNDSREGADFVKNIFDNWQDEKDDGEEKEKLNTWLAWNSPHHVRQLEKAAQKAGERGEYVSNFDQLVTLARYDWESARPTVDRLYSDASQPVSRVMATWALYTHALEEKSLGDIDRYRDELKAFVEDKKASAGMRDLAFDALVKEGEWSGRDDWYFSLLEDETLADLRVNGSSYTGLTTIVLYSHPDKYADKMIELVKSTNPVVRAAAVRNLSVIIDSERPDVIKALLPWLEDPKWAPDTGGARMKLLQTLQSVKVPESVPALIKLLDEKEVYYVNPNANAANLMANAANVAYNSRYSDVEDEFKAVANAANAIAMAANAVTANSVSNSNAVPKGKPVTHYPKRDDAVRALQMQEDMLAAPALRRILRETEGYQRSYLIKAILQCKGYTVAEQANALETMARSSREQMARVMAETGLSIEQLENDPSLARGATNSIIRNVEDVFSSPQGLEFMLGTELMQVREPGDQLIREVIARITQLEKKDPEISLALRGFLLMWKGSAINSLFLKDLKDGKADVHSVVKLLSIRKELQEKHFGEISDARRGGPVPSAVGACLTESEETYAEILNGENLEAKTALLACTRLIRAKLPVKEVAKSLSNTDKRLAAAAESYLESEDSVEARNIVLSLHPNKAKVMGATTGFWPEKSQITVALKELFDSTSDGSSSNSNPLMEMAFSAAAEPGKVESEGPLRDEIKKDADLAGIYSYEDNVIRIYKDRVAYSWGRDESRYHERFLSKEEFDGFAGYLASQQVDEMAPFLDCEQYSCESDQLLMLGKNGGRRIFVKSTAVPDFFAGLNSEFEKLRQGDAKLRYRLEKEVPGLEILMAEEDLAAITVWTNGSNVRVLIADAVKRKQIDTEIAKTVEEIEEEAEESDDESETYASEQKGYELEEKRRYENFEWFNFEAGRLGTKAAQPVEAEYVPIRDTFTVTAATDRWKSKTAAVEFRVDSEGLHKIAAGKITKYKTGDYSSPVVTPNGKWLFVSRYASGDDGYRLVRINLTTNREFPVKSDKFPVVRPIAYVASINKILASDTPSEDGEHYNGGEVFWVDPDTGIVQPAKGELQPLQDQTFRPLQPGPTPNEFWAAIPDGEGGKTTVGLYNTRTFTLKPTLTVPKIRFDSMDMWVDQTAGKVYFVYNGHLLSLPLTPKK